MQAVVVGVAVSTRGWRRYHPGGLACDQHGVVEEVAVVGVVIGLRAGRPVRSAVAYIW